MTKPLYPRREIWQSKNLKVALLTNHKWSSANFVAAKFLDLYCMQIIRGKQRHSSTSWSTKSKLLKKLETKSPTLQPQLFKPCIERSSASSLDVVEIFNKLRSAPMCTSRISKRLGIWEQAWHWLWPSLCTPKLMLRHWRLAARTSEEDALYLINDA